MAEPERDQDDSEATERDEKEQSHPTGERQAAINRDVDPPA
jgi:hypothetical protein